MRTILQLDPPIWLYVEGDPVLAYFLIRESLDHNLEWVCCCPARDNMSFTFDNSKVRFQENYTLDRSKPQMAEQRDLFDFPDIPGMINNTPGIIRK